MIAEISPLAPSQYIPPSQEPVTPITSVTAKKQARDVSPAITGAFDPLDVDRKYPIPNAMYSDIMLIVPT